MPFEIEYPGDPKKIIKKPGQLEDLLNYAEVLSKNLSLAKSISTFQKKRYISVR